MFFSCTVCKRWEKRIKSMKNFSSTWISPGSESIAKDSVEKHVEGAQHLAAADHAQRSLLGGAAYHAKVIEETPIGIGLKKMCEKDKEMMRFNSAYYLAKRERPFTDFPDLLVLNDKNKCPNIGRGYRNDNAAALFTECIAKISKNELARDLANARFYSVLSDGSTDTSVTEKELVYILYLCNGTPTVKYFSIEDVKTANAIGLQAAIEQSFKRIGITALTDRIVGLNCDGASVNMGQFTGLGARFKELAPWLEIIHCFNHRMELAFKDAFDKSPVFQKIDNFLLQLYYMYQKSPKRLRGLHEMSVAYQESIPKPTKANGTRWLEHKYSAIKIALENYGAYITHFEELTQTDSSWEKRAQIKGWLKLWKEANLTVNMSVYSILTSWHHFGD